MKGRIVFVTGSTDGIGLETARELATMGATVLVHARNAGRGKEAMLFLEEAVPRGDFDLFTGDLGDLNEVKKMGLAVAKKYPSIDVLINNAAVIRKKRELSANGIEMTFQVNHLSHFLLTQLLLDSLRRSPQGRIVNVSSMVHQSAKFSLDNIQGEKHYSGYNAYCCSKLVNMLFTVRLAEILADEPVTVNGLHPGVIRTKLLKAAGGGDMGGTLAKGASTSVYMASSDEVKGVSGKYFVNSKPAPAAPIVFDRHLQDEVWNESERLTKEFSV